jgi:hypothetical protein
MAFFEVFAHARIKTSLLLGLLMFQGVRNTGPLKHLYNYDSVTRK